MHTIGLPADLALIKPPPLPCSPALLSRLPRDVRTFVYICIADVSVLAIAKAAQGLLNWGDGNAGPGCSANACTINRLIPSCGSA